MVNNYSKLLFVMLFIIGVFLSCTKEVSKEIYLTFDDGPDSIYTSRVLDILKENNAHATFYVIGKQIVKYPNLIKRIADEGHELGIHTFHHALCTNLSNDSLLSEIVTTENLIKKYSGKDTKKFRPPWGAILPSQKLFLKEKGYSIEFWSIDSRDCDDKHNMPDSILLYLKQHVSNGDVILMHDGYNTNRENTISALPHVLFYFESKKIDFKAHF